MHYVYGKVLTKLKISTGKQELVDSVGAYRIMNGKKSDFEHDSKESPCFSSRLKKMA